MVDVETLRVNRALARFTDEIYRLSVGYLAGGLAAAYEPAALRAQSYTTAWPTSRRSPAYIYDWKPLVADPRPASAAVVRGRRPGRSLLSRTTITIGSSPMSWSNHTDVLTARNGVQMAQYNLKLAQITPFPRPRRVRWRLEGIRDPPVTGIYQPLQVGFPLPIWDQNKGNIIAAQAALIRAVEESHRVEITLTNILATAYTNYKNNLYAMEYYRRYILPDLVRYYRGVFDRRQVDSRRRPSATWCPPSKRWRRTCRPTWASSARCGRRW